MSHVVYAKTTHQFHNPQQIVASLKNSDSPGKAIYQNFCASCHAPKPMINIGAPRLRKTQEWESRIKQARQLLISHVIDGYNAMPPRGGCFECSDELLHSAINYMLSELQSTKSIKVPSKP